MSTVGRKSARTRRQEPERPLVLGAGSVLVVVGGVELGKKIVNFVVSAFDRVESLEGGAGPSRVLAPGQELARALEGLGVVGPDVEQGLVGAQPHVVARQGH